MGALQPGLPSPTVLPKNWTLIVVDLKDCFFTIPLHPKDAPRFAFSVPSINAAAPHDRYHWTVLPQGMCNSPTIYQWYVAKALAGIRTAHTQSLIYHCMDDILIASKEKTEADKILTDVTTAVTTAGLCIAQEKVQRLAPWQYLGWKIQDETIVPQKVKLAPHINTLNNLQKLLGVVSWLRPLLGIMTEELHSLFCLLKDDLDLTSSRQLTPSVKLTLERISTAIMKRRAQHIKDKLSIYLYVLFSTFQPFGLLGQWSSTDRDPLIILEWIFLPHQFTKTVTTRQELLTMVIERGRSRLMALIGHEPQRIYLAITQQQVDWLLQTSQSFQLSLAVSPGRIDIHFPQHQHFTSSGHIGLAPDLWLSPTPVPGTLTLFTGGSGKTGKSVITWKDVHDQWQSSIKTISGSPQIVELTVVVRCFQLFKQAFSIVTDLADVAGIVMRLEGSYLKEVTNPHLFALLRELQYLLNHRNAHYFVVHVRSHTSLPGPITEGNRVTDSLMGAVHVPNLFQQARISHEFFHQSANALRRTFCLTHERAQQLIQTCPDYQFSSPVAWAPWSYGK